MLTIKLSSGNTSWFLTAIYASPNYASRRDDWTNIQLLSEKVTGAWMILGDWNQIIGADEVRGGLFYLSRVEELMDVFHSCGLSTVNTQGGKFTWSRPRGDASRIYKRLDRAVSNLDWISIFTNSYLRILPRIGSDHCPILLHCGTPPARALPPFRWEASWALIPDYDKVVTDAWTRQASSICHQLQHVKEASVRFRQANGGNFKWRKLKLLKRMEGIARSLERIDSVRLILLDDELRKEYESLLAQEEVHWYQRSREKWVRLGDRNTSFFHAQTKMRCHRERIHGLVLPDGSWCEDEATIRHHARAYFQSLFASPTDAQQAEDPAASIPIPSPLPPIPESASLQLRKPVLREEISDVVNQFNGFFAPGPDGFPPFFYKHYWEILGPRIVEFVQEAYGNHVLPEGIARAFICLIPKVPSPTSLKILGLLLFVMCFIKS